MYRNTYVEINLDNIGKNVTQLIKKYNNYQYYFGVVNSNAYGHGILQVAKEIVKQGVNYLTVSNLDEALMIREKMKYVSILCLEPISLEHINVAIRNNITITISSYPYYEQLIAKSLKGDLKVHIKLDTGMNYLGINNKHQLEEMINILGDHKKILTEGLYTHLIDADNLAATSFDDQINQLIMLTKDIKLDEIPIIHIYNSEALLNHPKLKMANGVRLGICMYGINPIKHKDVDIKLGSTFSLYSRILETKEIKEGSYIGYNNSYQAKRDMLIGIVPIGYADGLSKNNKGRNVSINGVRYKIIGDIGMNMLALYIDEGIKVNDKVALIGEVVSIEEVASYLNTSVYEVLTSIKENIPRVYLKTTQQLK